MKISQPKNYIQLYRTIQQDIKDIIITKLLDKTILQDKQLSSYEAENTILKSKLTNLLKHIINNKSLTYGSLKHSRLKNIMSSSTPTINNMNNSFNRNYSKLSLRSQSNLNSCIDLHEKMDNKNDNIVTTIYKRKRTDSWSQSNIRANSEHDSYDKRQGCPYMYTTDSSPNKHRPSVGGVRRSSEMRKEIEEDMVMEMDQDKEIDAAVKNLSAREFKIYVERKNAVLKTRNATKKKKNKSMVPISSDYGKFDTRNAPGKNKNMTMIMTLEKEIKDIMKKNKENKSLIKHNTNLNSRLMSNCSSIATFKEIFPINNNTLSHSQRYIDVEKLKTERERQKQNKSPLLKKINF